MQVVLFDHQAWRQDFYPLSLTRPVANLRTGILTLNEKWERLLGCPVSFYTVTHLQALFPLSDSRETVLLIRGDVLGDLQAVAQLEILQPGEMLEDERGLWAGKLSKADLPLALRDTFSWKVRPTAFIPETIRYPEDLFLKNGAEIIKDYALITQGRISVPLSDTNRVLGDQLFIEPGARVECANINTLEGPVYIGKDSQVFEGCNIRGPFALGEGAILKMGTQVYSNVSIGPHSTIGGELNTCVVWGYSAKGHHGYFGSGVMGAWCNWGAGSSNSNLKNTYSEVTLFHYSTKRKRKTGLQVCGLIMGDYVRCGINTAFYTGCVIGTGVQVASLDPIQGYLPDFSWVERQQQATYRLEKLFETLKLVFQRRNRIFAESETRMLKQVFILTEEFRNL